MPRMRVDDRWHLAWRYRPSVNTMLLGGDFIGVAERANGSLSLLIGDVTGHGPASAGIGAMLPASWLGAVIGDVPLEQIPEMLHRVLINQADGPLPRWPPVPGRARPGRLADAADPRRPRLRRC